MLTPVLTAVLACAPLTTPAHTPGDDIVTTAVNAGSFTTLATALTEAGLIDALQGEGPFTVFAPSDEAFAKLPEGTIATLLKPENKARLTQILTYHVVPGRVASGAVVKLKSADSLNGQRLDIVANERGVTVDGAKVTTVDIECSNGIIHVIDSVMLPSADDVVDTAVANGSFKTLVAAVKAAGLVDTLKGDGPFTVLAPTDAAFAKLPAGTVETLLKPENKDQLVRILTYHVLPGRVYSDKALSQRDFMTVESSAVSFAADDHGATVGGAGLVATDIDTTNGVIHVIDSVIMPPARPASMETESSCSSSCGSKRSSL